MGPDSCQKSLLEQWRGDGPCPEGTSGEKAAWQKARWVGMDRSSPLLAVGLWRGLVKVKGLGKTKNTTLDTGKAQLGRTEARHGEQYFLGLSIGTMARPVPL